MQLDTLDKYGRNLVALAKKGKLDQCIGRDEELTRVIQILSRKKKNNPILLGPPGVGKRTIIYGLARRIAAGDVPDNLKKKIIYTVDFSIVLAGAKFRGELEERLQTIIKAVADSDGRVILFIENIHQIAKAAGGENSQPTGNILKPALSRGDLCCIGTTTFDDYRESIEKDSELDTRFQSVLVDEPNPADATAILRGLKNGYEAAHGVKVADSAINAAISLSERYVKDRFLPDKAIDLLDEACSALRMEISSHPRVIDEAIRKKKALEKERAALPNRHNATELDQQVSAQSDLVNQMLVKLSKERSQLKIISQLRSQVEQLTILADQAELEGRLDLASEYRYGKLHAVEKIIKQQEEVLAKLHVDGQYLREEVTEEDIAHVISRWTGIPAGKMLTSEKEKLRQMESVLGESVIAQPEAIRAVSQAIKRSRTGICSTEKPVGTFFFSGPTGVGKTECAKALANFLFDDDKAIIRLDMSEYMEKSSVARMIGAPPGYVGHEAGGQLTEKVRRKPYSVVLLDEVEKANPEVMNVLLQLLDEGRLTDGQGRLIDFRQTVVIMTSNVKENELKTYFKPEFLNRLDEVVRFNSLTLEALEKIVDIQVRSLSKRMAIQGMGIFVSPEACKYLAKEGFEPEYGARPLKRCFQRLLEDPISEKCLEGSLSPGKTLSVSILSNGERDCLVLQSS